MVVSFQLLSLRINNENLWLAPLFSGEGNRWGGWSGYVILSSIIIIIIDRRDLLLQASFQLIKICIHFLFSQFLALVLMFPAKRTCMDLRSHLALNFGLSEKRSSQFFLVTIIIKTSSPGPSGKIKLLTNYFRNPTITNATENCRKHTSGKQPSVDWPLIPSSAPVSNTV